MLSLEQDGFQNLWEYKFNFTEKVVRPSRKNETNGDIWYKMKHCPVCDDYGDLFRSHQVYCDEPWLLGEPCNVNEYKEGQSNLASPYFTGNSFPFGLFLS